MIDLHPNNIKNDFIMAILLAFNTLINSSINVSMAKEVANISLGFPLIFKKYV